MKSTGETWMGTAEAAEHLGVTLRTLYRLIDTGQVPAYKLGRVIRLRRDEVEEFIGASRIAPGQLAHLYPQPGPVNGEEEAVEGAGLPPAKLRVVPKAPLTPS
ncbi:MAG: helix-turn-helix domain-containing protein [Acidimicrobiales bacterium]